MNRIVLAGTAAAASILAAGAFVGCGSSNSTAAKPAGSATTAPGSAALVIEHVVRGCHSWALNGGPLTVNQTATLASGGTLSITDNDVMPHRLVELSGPVAVVSGAGMNHMGAVATVTFAKPGRYTFTTKAGEDYMKGVQTVGADHVLKLAVTVL